MHDVFCQQAVSARPSEQYEVSTTSLQELDALGFSDRAGSLVSSILSIFCYSIDLSVLRDRESTVLFEDGEMSVSFVGGDSSVEFARSSSRPPTTT